MKLDKDALKAQFRFQKVTQEWDIRTLQTVAFVAAGGGLIGRMYAEQPAVAYRDSRAGKALYRDQDLENIRVTLVALAEAQDLDPHNLPAMPRFPNCGVF